MRLRVKDLATQMYPNPFGLMLTWSAKGLDQVDFDDVKTVHFSTRAECELFRSVIEEKKLSCVLRYDEDRMDDVAQHNWTFLKGILTRHEIAISNGASYWLNMTHNEFGAITSMEHSCGAKIQITHDGQGKVAAITGNDIARKQVLETYFMEFCPESKLIDCRLKHHKDPQETDWHDECLFEMISDF